MITIDQVREAQRAAPGALETKELQRNYEAQRRAARAEKQAARNREQHEEDIRLARQYETCPARETEEVAAVYHDFATKGGWSHALEFKSVNVRGRIAIVSGGELVGWTNDNKIHTAEVLSTRLGAHWSNQPAGLSGYYVIFKIRLPDELRDVAKIDLI
jgi:hypothetical protein